MSVTFSLYIEGHSGLDWPTKVPKDSPEGQNNTKVPQIQQKASKFGDDFGANHLPEGSFH